MKRYRHSAQSLQNSSPLHESIVPDCQYVPMRYVGVSVRGGMVMLAAIERADGAESIGAFVEGGFRRRALPSENDPAASLFELKQSIQQDLRDWNAARVALVETTKYSQWKYSDAFARVLGISAAMYASAELNIAFELTKPSHVGKYLLAPAGLEPSRLGFSSPPKYWTTGGIEAYSAAAFAARS